MVMKMLKCKKTKNKKKKTKFDEVTLQYSLSYCLHGISSFTKDPFSVKVYISHVSRSLTNLCHI